MSFLRALENHHLVAVSHDDPRVPELIRAEEHRRDEIQLERIDETRPGGLVEEDDVARLEAVAHVGERDSRVALVAHPVPIDPSVWDPAHSLPPDQVRRSSTGTAP